MSNTTSAQDRETRVHYSWPAIGLHWVIAVLILAACGIAFYMEDLPRGPEQARIYALHKSIGVSVLVLALIRLGWRIASPPPPLPDHIKGWERRAAHGGHIGLYILMIVQPLLGIAHSQAANFPVVVWGLVQIPKFIPSSEGLQETLVLAHWAVGIGGLVLIIGHAAAALRHHFVLKDDILTRMAPGLSRRGNGDRP